MRRKKKLRRYLRTDYGRMGRDMIHASAGLAILGAGISALNASSS